MLSAKMRLDTTSSAPAPQFAPCGRETPRWSRAAQVGFRPSTPSPASDRLLQRAQHRHATNISQRGTPKESQQQHAAWPENAGEMAHGVTEPRQTPGNRRFGHSTRQPDYFLTNGLA